jgi:DNA-binding Xre family transcriptional regulator
MTYTRFPDLLRRKRGLLKNRFKVKYSLQTIADETGLSKQTVWYWAQGKPKRYDSDALEAICKWFPCTIGDLIVLGDRPEK